MSPSRARVTQANCSVCPNNCWAAPLRAEAEGCMCFRLQLNFSQHGLRWGKVLAAQLEAAGRQQWDGEAGGAVSPCWLQASGEGWSCRAPAFKSAPGSSWGAVAMSSPLLGQPFRPGELPQGTLKTNIGLSRADLTLAGNLMLPALHKSTIKIHWCSRGAAQQLSWPVRCSVLRLGATGVVLGMGQSLPVGLGIPLLSLLSVLSCSLQSETLQQLRKDSESIRSRYAHYFDLSIVNNGVEESLKLLEEAFEQACSSPQWVPVSWVY